MRFHIDRSTFLGALAHNLNIVEKRSTIPVLSHILIEVANGRLVMTSTDIDVGLVQNMPVTQVTEEGSAAVPAQQLFEIIKKLSDKLPLHLFMEEGRFHIHAGRSKFELPCLSADDFPNMSHGELPYRFTLSRDMLIKLIDHTRFAMSHEEKRYHLNGVCFQRVSHSLFGKKGAAFLRAVATDLHRLACAEEPCDESIPEGCPEFIISRKTIHELRRLLDEIKGDVSISLSDARIELTYEVNDQSGTLSARLVEGTFPDYVAAFGIDSEHHIVVPTREFAQSVDRISVLVDEKIKGIYLTAQNNVLTLSTGAGVMGQATEELDVDYPHNEPLRLCFNTRYVLDIAQQIHTDQLELCANNSDSPVLLRPVEESIQQSYILMPMHL